MNLNPTWNEQTAHEWLTLPDVEVRRLKEAGSHPAVKVHAVEDEDEPLPALRAKVIGDYPNAVVVYVTGPAFRSYLNSDGRQIKQAFCYLVAFDTWRDAADALQQGLKVGYMPIP